MRRQGENNEENESANRSRMLVSVREGLFDAVVGLPSGPNGAKWYISRISYISKIMGKF